MFITLLLFIFIVYLVYHYYVHYGRFGQLIHKIPGPPGYPLIGNFFLLMTKQEHLINLLFSLCDKYYPIFRTWAFFEGFVSIRHPDDLEVILNSSTNIEKSRIYSVLHPWFGLGLLTSGGSKWHSRRKILTPTFHFNILQQFVEILIEEGESMTNSLKNAGSTITKDLVPLISEHTLNAICETAMGTSLQGMNSVQQEYRKAVHRMGELFIYRLVRHWLISDWIFALTSQGREQVKILKILHGFTNKIIAERKDYHKRTNGQYLKNFNQSIITDNEEIVGSKKKRLAMLDFLIYASQEGHLTDVDIREEVDTFMFEGHDTTSTSLCYTLALLAENKDIQDRVRQEVDLVMQENEGKLTIKSLQNLQYLERCIKESLRLYPSVYFISRITTEEAQLKSHLIPVGTIMHLHIYGVHRDPNFWPNPDVFDPDRFLPENSRNRHPYSYIPFSAGPRNCIGQRFAMLEMKAMIAPLIHNFCLEPVDLLKNLRVGPDLVLRPLGGHRIKFIPIATKCI
ncbi:cytochrome P450 4C1-like isoform X1 [Solenopsis invicta]|uniref:cytochrome P450 4C1-like isoform X1 n=2 Tax=Solenopsis invicta TaxID=13686 RepID=UPI00193DA3BA|nr:cytochrome P450 4C1-like isoform X1 [Solenopsis invicta]XP_039304802.1 cytochrome P450 4C1-like isoform X1 [Solenopsis invicta]XP_039304803.1 cytochrome P450 4C1-like isoform X1 [Solenopsis invicta]